VSVVALTQMPGQSGKNPRLAPGPDIRPAPLRRWGGENAGRTHATLPKLFKQGNGAHLATLLIALWKLFKHPDTPWAPRWVAIAVLAYVVSPIDLLPDFIPVIGLLDELVLVPMGVALAVRLTPPALWRARLAEAEAAQRLCRGCCGARSSS
jgi:uncharacterized membrane protein YkvA (DUF1232 family)